MKYDFAPEQTNHLPLLDGWLIVEPVSDVLSAGLRVVVSRVTWIHTGSVVWVTDGYRLTATEGPDSSTRWLVRGQDVFAWRHK